MGALERLVQADSMASSSEAVAEFNIFDRTWKAFRVEAADLQEYRASDRPAPGPKRRCLWIAVLVYKVMQQISILGNDAFGARAGIIGAENGGHVWMLGELFDDAT